MVNKKGLWFLTLFSLILVMSVYYVTMPNDLLAAKTYTQDNKNTKEVTTTLETVTSDDVLVGGNVSEPTTVSKVTVNSLTFEGVEFEASWETDGLKIPMVVNNGNGNFPFFLRIKRDQVIKMFKDINEHLSHT